MVSKARKWFDEDIKEQHCAELEEENGEWVIFTVNGSHALAVEQKAVRAGFEGYHYFTEAGLTFEVRKNE